MKQLKIIQQSQSNLQLDFNKELLKSDEDEFIAFLQDSIKLLESQLLSIEQS
jgi:hypothetical protein